MEVFNHSSRNKNNGPNLFGVILILMGVIVLIFPQFFDVNTPYNKVLMVSGIPLMVGLFLISTYSGTLIDFDANRYKEYQSILWFKIGDWQSLPKIENAELIHHTFLQRNTPNGISPTLSRQVTIYKCVLIAENQKFMAFDYTKEAEAIAALEKIKDGFNMT